MVEFLDILKVVAPGTSLRTAIDDIVRAEKGALIVVSTPNLERYFEGGFRLDSDFTAQKLMELSKLDGAIILSENLDKILYANVFITTSSKIDSSETGARHKTAEKIAKEVRTLVIAVSERRKKVTLFYNDWRYVLRDTEDLIVRATETLQILERQRILYDELITNLNILEITNLVSVSDVISVLQRTETILKMEELLKISIVELGKEGVIIKMRLRELLKNIERDKRLILKDYFINKMEDAERVLASLGFEDLLEVADVSEKLFSKSPEDKLYSKGFRILSKTFLNDKEISIFIKRAGGISMIFELDIEALSRIFNKEIAIQVKKELDGLKNQIMIGKKI